MKIRKILSESKVNIQSKFKNLVSSFRSFDQAMNIIGYDHSTTKIGDILEELENNLNELERELNYIK